MSERATHHATFVIERTYAASPAKLTGHQTYINSVTPSGAQEGWAQTLDRLTEDLAKA